MWVDVYQECTQHVEAHKVDYGKASSTGVLLPGQEVRLGVTLLPVQAGQHHFLPRLPCSTPAQEMKTLVFIQNKNIQCFSEKCKKGDLVKHHPETAHPPKEYQHSLRECLKVVVPVDVRSIHQGYFTKDLQ